MDAHERLKGKMHMNTFLIAGASALAVLAAGTASAQPARGGFDRNADISRTELAQKLEARFARLDANGDGTVSVEEHRAAREARRAQRAERKGDGEHARGERRGGKRGGGDHASGERRGAGAPVTRAEFLARGLERFDRADADRNGILTAAERKAQFEARKERRQAR